MTSFYVPLNVWTHVALTHDDVVGYSMFVGGMGVKVSQQNAFNITDSKCAFGKDGFPSLAIMDDVMFFNRTLSASEVQVYMNLS